MFVTPMVGGFVVTLQSITTYLGAFHHGNSVTASSPDPNTTVAALSECNAFTDAPIACCY